MLVVITMLASTALLSAQDQTPLTKDQFMVATDLYLIDVNKL
jgi:hypothetical protein